MENLAKTKKKNRYVEIRASTPNLGNCGVEDESSNDSCSLQIVIPGDEENRKRKLPFDINKEIENDIEMSLETKQKKTNLTVKNVKSILRYVIENENVLAMINNSMGESGLDVEQKITRSKARQLREENQIIWPLSPIPATQEGPVEKEHLVLISEDLPEEEDDDEYRPALDDLQDHSDDESGRASFDQSTASRYLANFDPGLLDDSVPELNVEAYSIPSDDVFKKPMEVFKPESIGQRTRSKLSLSSTPLEAIEQAFVPPDITTDMYDFKCDDQEWENFLKEFMQPLPSDNIDPDEEDDPEYNAMAEVEQIDEEELRRDRAVKVSRAEVRRLMEELAGAADELSSDEDETQRETTGLDKSILEESVEKSVESFEKPVKDITNSEDEFIGVTSSQQLLILQQMRQHVQLLTQNFLQLHCHPIYRNKAKGIKTMLGQLVELAKMNPKSAVNVYNLHRSFILVEKWERFMMTEEGKDIIAFMETEVEQVKLMRNKKLHHKASFHPTLMRLIVHSDVFMYPGLLPHQPFCPSTDRQRGFPFCSSEDHLIAMGLENFIPHVKQHPRWSDARNGPVLSAADMIHELLMTPRLTKQIACRIKAMKHVIGNPIWHYSTHGTAPGQTHFIIPFDYSNIPGPMQQGDRLLPPLWLEYVNHVRNCRVENCDKCGRSLDDSEESEDEDSSP